MVAFLADTKIFELLADNGQHTALHIPISGGDEYETTLKCFDDLCSQFAAAPVKIIPWLNRYHGTTVSPNGVPFEKSEVVQKHAKAIATTIGIPAWPPEIRRVVSELFKSKETFAQGAEKHENQILVRQRILVAQREMFDTIANSGICEPSFFASAAKNKEKK